MIDGAAEIGISAINAIFFLLLFSIGLRQSLIYAGQSWVQTFSHTMAILFLPIITFTITSVISGNIALSLGMVGALSIVRFRHPVKSPFELVVYFLIITMGIAASVEVKWMMMLVSVCMFLLMCSKALDSLFLEYFGKKLFQVSFSEGAELSTLEVRSNSSLADLLEHSDLMTFFRNGDGFEYVVASRNKDVLLSLANEFEDDNRIIELRFGTH